MKGAASADHNDGSRLKDFIKLKGLDPLEYDPVGIFTEFYSGEYHYRIICRNPEDPTNKRLIKLHFNPEITTKEYWGLVDNYSSIVVEDNIKVEEIESLKDVTKDTEKV